MTKEEAKRFLQSRIDLIDSDYPSETDYRDALVLAIKALEQCEVWDGIHGQVVAPKGTFDRMWNDAEKEKQEPKTEWIPVSERLPEEREWYLTIFKEKDTGYQLVPRVADYIGKGKNKWRVIDEEGLCQEYRDILECIAWMPLPEPYKESEVEE